MTSQISIDEREYWDRRDAQMSAESTATREHAASPEAQLHRLHVQYSATPDVMTEKRAEIMSQISTLSAEIKSNKEAAFAAEWTLELTKTRRAAWNARVSGGEFGRDARTQSLAARQAESAQGWSIESLKRAVKHHGL